MKVSFLIPFLVFFIQLRIYGQCFLQIEKSTDELIVCPGASDTFHFDLSGGEPPYTYTWTPSKGLSSTSDANPICSLPGLYYLTVTDKSGCKVTEVFTFDWFPSPHLNLGPDMTICAGDTAELQTYSIDEFISFFWTPSAGLDRTDILNPVISPDETTTYILDATDHDGCKISDTVTIRVNPLPSIHKSFLDISISKNQDYQIEGINVSGGKAPYAFYWISSDSLEFLPQDPNTFVLNPTISPKKTTEYILEVSDGNACLSRESVLVKVK